MERSKYSNRGVGGVGGVGAWTARLLQASCVLASMAGPVHVAYAQSASSSTGEALEEIIVTAERRETDLQKTAISLTALTGEDMQQSGKTTIEDALATVPNVRLQTGLGVTSIFIRGVGPSLTTDAAVSLNLDGVYQTDGTAGEQFDIARYEVLRGPQGTFYGRNATAGSVNIITNDPTNELHASGTVQGGNYSAIHTEGVVNVPISDAVAVRTAISTDRHLGYYTNGTNDLDAIAMRGKVLFKPTESLRILLDGEYVHNGGHGGSTVPGSLTTPLIPASDPYFDPGPTGITENRKISTYAKVDWDLGFGVLTWLPAYYSVSSKLDTDLLYAPPGLSAVTTYNDQHTEELRLASSASSRVVWVAGFYYLDHRNKQPPASEIPATPLAAGTRGAPPPFPRINTSSEDKASAVFGQVTYPLADALRFTVGARYTKDQKYRTGVRYSAPYTIDPTFPATTFGKTNDAVTGKVGAEYDVAPASMLYAQVSKGYKSGGLNNIGGVAVTPGGAPIGPQRPTSYDPEKIIAYEVGIKNRFLDNTLQLNAAAYYYDYTDQQIFAVYLDPVIRNPLVTVLNAAKSRVYGTELEGQWLLTTADRISASATYNSAKFVSYCNPPPIGVSLANSKTCSVQGAIGIDRAGLREPNAPEWTGMLSYEHSFALPHNLKLSPSATIRYTSAYDASAEPKENLNSQQDAYHQSDARLVLGDTDGKWDLNFFVNNIENKAVIIQGLRAPGPPPPAIRFQLAPPRTFGASFSARL